MFESLHNIREEVLELLKSTMQDNCDQISTLRDTVFWEDFTEVLKIIRPLANCIAVAEKANGSVGETIKHLLDFAESLFAQDWDNQFTLSAINAFFIYFSPSKLGDFEYSLYIAAYFLDRRYKMDFVTKEGAELVMITLVKLATLCGFSSSIIETVLIDEYMAFCAQEGSFSRTADKDKSAIEWWQDQPDTGVLRKIGMRLANLKSSSANIERLFSIISGIQGKYKTNFSISTLTHIARVKLSISQDLNDMPICDSLDTSSSQEVETQPKRNPIVKRVSKRFRDLSTRILHSHHDSQRASGPSPSKLSRHDGAREQYEKFIKIFDFTIINQVKESSIQPQEEPAPEDIDRMVKRFRSQYRGVSEK